MKDSIHPSEIISGKITTPKQTHDNVELGSPITVEPEVAPFMTSFINLLKTIIGSGILGLPIAIQNFGLIPGVTLMLLAAGTATFGLHILNVAAMQLGRKASFSGICSLTYPKAAFAFELAIAAKCTGTSIAYLSAMGDMAQKLGRKFLNLAEDQDVPEGFINACITNKAFWVVALVACISPICFMKRMDSLKYTSYAGMGVVVYLVILTIANFFSSPESSFSNIPFMPTFSLSIFRSYGTLIFAYTCHQNILPIQNEARNNTPRGMMNVIGTAMFISTFLYMTVALFGAASSPKVADNILNNFPDTLYYNIARGLYIFLLLFSYPLQVFPCRNSIEKMTLFYLRAERLPKETVNMLYLGSTLAIIGVTAFVGTLPIKLNTALNIVGSVAGNFICYLFPAVLFNKLFEGTPMNMRRIGSYLLLAFGVVSFVLSGTGIIVGFFA